MFESVVTYEICRHLSNSYLLSDKQFEFEPARSASDLLKLLTKGRQDALDEGLNTIAVVLDIAGATDKMSHGGLLEKLCKEHSFNVTSFCCGELFTRQNTPGHCQWVSI